MDHAIIQGHYNIAIKLKRKVSKKIFKNSKGMRYKSFDLYNLHKDKFPFYYVDIKSILEGLDNDLDDLDKIWKKKNLSNFSF